MMSDRMATDYQKIEARFSRLSRQSLNEFQYHAGKLSAFYAPINPF